MTLRPKYIALFGKRKIWLSVIVICFVLLFLYTAWTKWADYAAFQDEISHSLWREWLPARAAWVVPVVETILAILLLIPKGRLLGLIGALFFMVITSAYLLLTLNSQPEIPCACGGFIEQMPKSEHLALNIGLTALTAIGIVLYKLLAAYPSRRNKRKSFIYPGKVENQVASYRS